MTFLSAQELNDIQHSIETVEKRTSAELVTVIAPKSDDYLYIPTLWAALMALALPGLITLLAVPWMQDNSYLLQFLCFISLTLLFQWRPFKFRLIPKAIKQQRAHWLAQQQFLLRNLHHTEQRSGVLIFVSVAEHYVEILADKGINDLVEENTWQDIVQTFVQQVRQGKVAQGFIDSIESCGQLLAEKFPPRIDGNGENKNELPDRLVQL